MTDFQHFCTWHTKRSKFAIANRLRHVGSLMITVLQIFLAKCVSERTLKICRCVELIKLTTSCCSAILDRKVRHVSAVWPHVCLQTPATTAQDRHGNSLHLLQQTTINNRLWTGKCKVYVKHTTNYDQSLRCRICGKWKQASGRTSLSLLLSLYPYI